MYIEFSRGSDKLKFILKAEWIALKDKSHNIHILTNGLQWGAKPTAPPVRIWHLNQVKASSARAVSQKA